MAMLAEPRRKQKVINLRAKNSAWSKDANKFGQRMLEKMGWSAGKGLGAKENGIVEHVVARYKNDEKGLGFEDRNDQWTKHEDDFNALLANLSNGGADEKEPQTHSGVSLEVKSKKSKARVHFHKFTRAKDLSRYSEKDLANIFGKKALKPEGKKEELLKEDMKTTEQVFTDKGSMDDYFKNKLQVLNSKNKVCLPINDNRYEDDADCGFQGFSGTTNENEESENTSGFGFSFHSSSVQNTLIDEYLTQNGEIETPVIKENLDNIKKSKKKKKNKKNDEQGEVLETTCTLNVKKSSLISESDNCIPNDTLEESVTKKKKKSKKRESIEENIVKKDENQEENYVPIKKKKKKNKKSDE